MTIIPDQKLDVRELRCPLPLLKTRQRLAAMDVGEILAVSATDAGSWRDIPVFAGQCGHELVKAECQAGIYYYWIKKGSLIR